MHLNINFTFNDLEIFHMQCVVWRLQTRRLIIVEFSDGEENAQ